MKIKYIGDEDEITLRSITFPKGKPVDVDCSELVQKVAALPYFQIMKARKNGKKQA